MKRILLITLDFFPSRGGIARYYDGLLSALPRENVFVLAPSTVYQDHAPYTILRRRFFLSWFWPKWLPLFWYAFRAIRTLRPDEVWVGQVLPIGTAVFILTSFCFRTLPYAVFTYGMDLAMARRSRWKQFLVTRILRRATRVIANSHFVKREVFRFGISEEKVIVVHPCPTISQISNLKSQNLREQYHLHGKKILLTVARLVKRKGIDLVLEALRRVQEKIPNLIYVVVGDGPEREAFEVTCQVSGVRCQFVGAIPDDELAAWYSISDVFIMTPRTLPGDVEGFGMVYLEAHTFGKPVIGTRSGGVPEAVLDGETGFLVEEGDVDGIARAIERLFSDTDLRKKLGEQGKKRVEQEFQWSIQIKPLV